MRVQEWDESYRYLGIPVALPQRAAAARPDSVGSRAPSERALLKPRAAVSSLTKRGRPASNARRFSFNPSTDNMGKGGQRPAVAEKSRDDAETKLYYEGLLRDREKAFFVRVGRRAARSARRGAGPGRRL